jgi:hypothetical protein
MHRKLISLGATAAVAAAALAPTAGAADTTAAQAPVLKGAYLYVDHIAASKQDFVRVVFRTAEKLPRRYDGSIQAGASIDGVGHSLGSAKRGTACYTAASEIKRGRVASHDADGKLVHKRAKVGTTFKVTVSLRDGGSVTRTLKLRAERKGDDTGKPLGC